MQGRDGDVAGLIDSECEGEGLNCVHLSIRANGALLARGCADDLNAGNRWQIWRAGKLPAVELKGECDVLADDDGGSVERGFESSSVTSDEAGNKKSEQRAEQFQTAAVAGRRTDFIRRSFHSAWSLLFFRRFCASIGCSSRSCNMDR